MLTTPTTRPQLPALTYLDVDKAKRDDEPPQSRSAGASQTQYGAPIASPTYYPPNPPPPYSQPPPQHAPSWPVARPPVQTPPDSRRTSGEDTEYLKKTSRHSLPSISEALGETSYTSTAQPPSQVTAPASPPPSATRKTYAMDPPQSNNAYGSNSNYPAPSFRQDSAGPQSYPPPDSTKPAFAPLQEPRPPLHVQTSQPTPRTQQTTSYPYTQNTSPQFDQQQSSQSSASMGPPQSFPYGYTPYPPKYTQPTSSSSHGPGPIYQPSVQHAPPSMPSSSWKAENASRFGADDRSSATTYSESVKRHLDLFDLEGSLNEVSQCQKVVQAFF